MVGKATVTKLFLIFMFSSLVALLVASYTETHQSPFFSAVKNLVLHGSGSRYVESEDVLHTRYDWGAYINPVHVAQSVYHYSERSLIELFELDFEAYKFIDRNPALVVGIADIFIENYESEIINGLEVMRYPYHFDYPAYSLNAPWYSGMAQGHAAVVFLHAYKLTGEGSYLSYAKKSIDLLQVPLDDGGVLIHPNLEGIWFEEYADPQKDPTATPRVLNGNIFAIDGLFWFWYITKDEQYKDLLRESVLAVEDHISLYDSGVWSYYDARFNLAHAGYHELHIKQLKRLSTYSNIIGLEEPESIHHYAKKYTIYQKIPFLGFAQRMLFQRNNMVYVLFLSNLVATLICVCLLRMISVRRYRDDRQANHV